MAERHQSCDPSLRYGLKDSSLNYEMSMTIMVAERK